MLQLQLHNSYTCDIAVPVSHLKTLPQQELAPQAACITSSSIVTPVSHLCHTQVHMCHNNGGTSLLQVYLHHYISVIATPKS